MSFQDANEALKHHSEESFSRLVVSMEEKFEESLKAEKEQMELAFKLKAKDHDLYDRLANSPITTRANSRRASLAKISSMSDLLALKAPTLEMTCIRLGCDLHWILHMTFNDSHMTYTNLDVTSDDLLRKPETTTQQ